MTLSFESTILFSENMKGFMQTRFITSKFSMNTLTPERENSVLVIKLKQHSWSTS